MERPPLPNWNVSKMRGAKSVALLQCNLLSYTPDEGGREDVATPETLEDSAKHQTEEDWALSVWGSTDTWEVMFLQPQKQATVSHPQLLRSGEQCLPCHI